ncbi:hypothetical protein [uncultured Salinisphaera sp.]|uniref:hypothetical protein n=1 Tax=uncultured Salinisphaera sp. TaxID=359372 RepID=UPI0032B22E4C|tara:strand:+ start:89 stop:535 length:447 start_codon:yes stop_codon:yes gene_type:complete
MDDTAAANAPAARAGENSAARALLRYMAAYDDVGTDNGARVPTLCVGVGAQVNALSDPRPAMLARLKRSLGRAVVPASQCTAGARATDAEGNPARIIYVQKQRQDNARSFIFRGGYYEANLGAATGLYRVERSADDWYITPDGPQAVS